MHLNNYQLGALVDNAHEERLRALEERLGVEFRDRRLLMQAVTHRSYVNEHGDSPGHNELLEFLGDSVLGLITREHLVHTFPDRSEGELSTMTAALVNGDRLQQIATDLALIEVVLSSRGEEQAKEGRGFQRILGDVVEALLGALFLDQGLGACRIAVDHWFLRSLSQTVSTFVDHKSIFQERLQAVSGITPTYRVITMTGSGHGPQFVVGVYVGSRELAQGEGASKKDAEQDAARKALLILATPEGHLTKRGHVRRFVKRHSGGGSRDGA